MQKQHWEKPAERKIISAYIFYTHRTVASSAKECLLSVHSSILFRFWLFFDVLVHVWVSVSARQFICVWMSVSSSDMCTLSSCHRIGPTDTQIPTHAYTTTHETAANVRLCETNRRMCLLHLLGLEQNCAYRVAYRTRPLSLLHNRMWVHTLYCYRKHRVRRACLCSLSKHFYFSRFASACVRK